MMKICNKIQLIYGKLFGGGEWKVAYRNLADKHAKYEIINAPKDTWIADPLLFEDGGNHYLFVELFNKTLDKAGIGYYQFFDGKPIFQKQILEQPFHLSYPCIFLWEGNYYMVPESAAGNTLDLYKAVHFPDTWELDANLLIGEKYVDTTVIKQNGQLYALGYHKKENGWELAYFTLDMQKKKLVKISGKSFSENKGRPAGYVLQEEMLRPAQDCSNLYGESVIWYQIDEMSKSTYREHPVSEMKVTDLGDVGNADRVHTYSKDSIYEVVDLRYGKFDLFHGFRSLRRAMRGKRATQYNY